MTTPAAHQPEPRYADRVHRSVPGAVSGALLLAITLWLAVDAMVNGSGHDAGVAVAALFLVAPPIFAYTLWPCVRIGPERLVVRNPLRVISVPWASVESIEAGYSVELHAGGATYQIWSIPVSLRQRKRAGVRAARAAAGGDPYASPFFRRSRRDLADTHPVGGPGLRTAGQVNVPGAAAPDPTRAWSDRIVDELRETADSAKRQGEEPGKVTVTWLWWIIAPTVAGAVALAALLATG
jgi:hypothetical protein